MGAVASVSRAPFAPLAVALLLIAAIATASWLWFRSEAFTVSETIVGDSSSPTERTLDISGLGAGVAMLFSAFDPASYGGKNAKVWKDISGRADAGHVCTAQGCTGTRDIELASTPALDATRGVWLRGVRGQGPMSMNLGIDGASAYTWVWHAQHNDLPADTTVRVFTAYANSRDNVGLDVALVVPESPDERLGVRLSHADEPEAFEGKLPFLPSDAAHHTYVIVKDHAALRMYVDDSGVPVVNVAIQNRDVLYSNRRMELNPDGNWDAYVTAFGLLQRPVAASEVSGLHAFFQQQRVEQTPEWRGLKQKQLQAAEELDKVRACPYKDAKVCEQDCAGVTDWSTAASMMAAANDTCLRGIAHFCETHPDHPACGCWSPAHKHVQSCVRIREAFSGVPTSLPAPAVAADALVMKDALPEKPADGGFVAPEPQGWTYDDVLNAYNREKTGGT